jgi:ssRNA-specific RNase YbeY (16S rRNA maturation enzyme)
VCDANGRPAAASAPGLGRWLQKTAPASVKGEMTIALVSNARMRAMNRAYRGKDYATDVLSFLPEAGAASDVRIKPGRSISPAHTSPLSAAARAAGARAGRRQAAALVAPVDVSAGSAPAHLGDVVIATGVAARQAREAGHSLSTELRILALHGLLHLLGYDHERDRGEMARVERRWRRRGGLREGLIERAV